MPTFYFLNKVSKSPFCDIVFDRDTQTYFSRHAIDVSHNNSNQNNDFAHALFEELYVPDVNSCFIASTHKVSEGSKYFLIQSPIYYNLTLEKCLIKYGISKKNKLHLICHITQLLSDIFNKGFIIKNIPFHAIHIDENFVPKVDLYSCDIQRRDFSHENSNRNQTNELIFLPRMIFYLFSYKHEDIEDPNEIKDRIAGDNANFPNPSGKNPDLFQNFLLSLLGELRPTFGDIIDTLTSTFLKENKKTQNIILSELDKFLFNLKFTIYLYNHDYIIPNDLWNIIFQNHSDYACDIHSDYHLIYHKFQSLPIGEQNKSIIPRRFDLTEELQQNELRFLGDEYIKFYLSNLKIYSKLPRFFKLQLQNFQDNIFDRNKIKISDLSYYNRSYFTDELYFSLQEHHFFVLKRVHNHLQNFIHKEIDIFDKVTCKYIVKEKKINERELILPFFPCFSYQYFLHESKHNKSMKISISDRILWLIEMATALSAIHQEKYSHDNISNQIFFVNEYKDLYLATIAYSRTAEIQATKVSGAFFYRSPEEFLEMEKENINHKPSTLLELKQKADIYSYGILAYETLTSIEPSSLLENRSRRDKKQIIIDRYMIDEQRIFPQLPYELSEFNYLINKCMEEDPGNRFDTFEKVIDFIKNTKIYQKNQCEIESRLFLSKPAYEYKCTLNSLVLTDFYSLNNVNKYIKETFDSIQKKSKNYHKLETMNMKDSLTIIRKNVNTMGRITLMPNENERIIQKLLSFEISISDQINSQNNGHVKYPAIISKTAGNHHIMVSQSNCPIRILEINREKRIQNHRFQKNKYSFNKMNCSKNTSHYEINNIPLMTLSDFFPNDHHGIQTFLYPVFIYQLGESLCKIHFNNQYHGNIDFYTVGVYYNSNMDNLYASFLPFNSEKISRNSHKRIEDYQKSDVFDFCKLVSKMISSHEIPRIVSECLNPKSNQHPTISEVLLSLNDSFQQGEFQDFYQKHKNDHYFHIHLTTSFLNSAYECLSKSYSQMINKSRIFLSVIIRQYDDILDDVIDDMLSKMLNKINENKYHDISEIETMFPDFRSLIFHVSKKDCFEGFVKVNDLFLQNLGNLVNEYRSKKENTPNDNKKGILDYDEMISQIYQKVRLTYSFLYSSQPIFSNKNDFRSWSISQKFDNLSKRDIFHKLDNLSNDQYAYCLNTQIVNKTIQMLSGSSDKYSQINKIKRKTIQNQIQKRIQTFKNSQLGDEIQKEVSKDLKQNQENNVENEEINSFGTIQYESYVNSKIKKIIEFYYQTQKKIIFRKLSLSEFYPQLFVSFINRYIRQLDPNHEYKIEFKVSKNNKKTNFNDNKDIVDADFIQNISDKLIKKLKFEKSDGNPSFYIPPEKKSK
ncbi:hypothetical protein TRFO_37459 [Tritrichomonas foetus]|uniref:Protein kinase domain-containing protein n=1 Tax=Tritrichomonas foetus TaxID=1144522 RepID=A0A1J4JB61_9EUKA|nr:hypothetical protein TRFO_37459 [Tritrichomonas foetus]|eukprot:OHS96414.1 hypothetical protein TRFO_37459 [Tritrichomonas foetus]